MMQWFNNSTGLPGCFRWPQRTAHPTIPALPRESSHSLQAVLLASAWVNLATTPSSTVPAHPFKKAHVTAAHSSTAFQALVLLHKNTLWTSDSVCILKIHTTYMPAHSSVWGFHLTSGFMYWWMGSNLFVVCLFYSFAFRHRGHSLVWFAWHH